MAGLQNNRGRNAVPGRDLNDQIRPIWLKHARRVPSDTNDPDIWRGFSKKLPFAGAGQPWTGDICAASPERYSPPATGVFCKAGEAQRPKDPAINPHPRRLHGRNGVVRACFAVRETPGSEERAGSAAEALRGSHRLSQAGFRARARCAGEDRLLGSAPRGLRRPKSEAYIPEE